MLDTVVKIVSIIGTTFNTVVKLVEVLQKRKDKHQKSDRTTPKV